MKKLLILTLFNLLGSSLLAQEKYISDTILTKIDSQLVRYQFVTDSLYKANKTWLVSTYTFRSLVQKDYSKITIGENSFTKIGRFATLNINKDESKFYFTPITLVRYQDPTKGSFKYIHSIDISGEVNDQNIFDFKSKKSLKAGYSLTRILAGYTPKPCARQEAKHEEIVKLTFDQALSKYRKGQTKFEDYLKVAYIVEITDTNERYDAIKKDFFKSLEDHEQKFYEEKWAVKKIAWIKLNMIPISWDNFSYIDPMNPATSSKPADKSVYTGNIKASYNELYTFSGHKKQQFYWNIYASIGRKHSLSEISKPSQWYNVKSLTDSTLTVSDDKKTFTLQESSFKTKYRPDAGVQIIYLFKLGNNTIGMDFASSMNGLVSEKSSSFVNRSSAGILFPFLDKAGESTINVEVFYQRKSFINMNITNEGFWGIKFGLPFSSL